MIEDEILKELSFKAIRSSGAGGQHVNKTSSKVELTFNVEHSNGLSYEEKELLKAKLQSKLSNNFDLIIYCDESRSQHQNKELVIKRFIELIKINLKKPKKRKATKPSKAAIQKRLDTKQNQSSKKELRKKPKID